MNIYHSPACYNKSIPSTHESSSQVTRRDWLTMGIVAAGLGTTTLVTNGPAWADAANPPTASTQPMIPKNVNVDPQLKSSNQVEIKPVNLTMVAAENKINITLRNIDSVGRLSSCTYVDPKTFNKIKVREYPNWWPEALRPAGVVVREFTNTELLAAGVVAGASIDIIRSTILYPIATIKARIQATANTGPRLREPLTLLRLKRRLLVLYLNIRNMVNEGNLYAGLIPTLLASVPATGLYFGTRDVTKRLLNKVIDADASRFNLIIVALTAAFLGDVVSLAARTPVDALALRLQVISGEEPDAEMKDLEVGDWFGDSVKRLPAVIATDLPYLLSRISFNMILATGTENIGRYEVIAISTGIICSILTTPFDVARTRILVDSDGDPSNGLDGGSRQGVITCLRSISQEGDGGLRNLFAGWFERALYLGIGRAWLDPILLIVYVAIRDATLLKWFD